MSSPQPSGFNAHTLGVHSVAAAAIFSVLYAPLGAFFLYKLIIQHRTAVWRFLLIFCLIRITSFALRAVIAGSDAAARNQNLYIAQQITYSLGFVSLIFSTFSLVLDREALNGPSNSSLSRFVRTSQFRRLYGLVLTVAIILGIIGTSDSFSSSPDERDLGKTLRTAGSSIIFAVVVGLAVLAIAIAADENKDRSPNRPITGSQHASKIIIAIAVLLVMREAYIIAGLAKPPISTNEAWLYPFAVLTEFLVTLAFLAPGLVLVQNDQVSVDSESELVSSRY